MYACVHIYMCLEFGAALDELSIQLLFAVLPVWVFHTVTEKECSLKKTKRHFQETVLPEITLSLY